MKSIYYFIIIYHCRQSLLHLRGASARARARDDVAHRTRYFAAVTGISRDHSHVTANPPPQTIQAANIVPLFIRSVALSFTFLPKFKSAGEAHRHQPPPRKHATLSERGTEKASANCDPKSQIYGATDLGDASTQAPEFQ